MSRRRTALVVALILASAAPALEMPSASAGSSYPPGPVALVSGEEIQVAPFLEGAAQSISSIPDFQHSPDWSPAANRIAFTVSASGGVGHVWVTDADGTGAEQLTDAAVGDRDPDWSPDGEHIVFSREVGPDDFALFVMESDGGNVAQITPTGSPAEVAPAWSPDGARIAYTSVTGFVEADIVTIDPDGSDAVNLTLTPLADFAPAWSPDGTTIAYAAFDGELNADVWTMADDGTGKVQLTDDEGFDGHPAWSPNGAYLAFESDRSGDDEIWAMQADGSDESQITNDGDNGEPDWTAPCVDGFTDTPTWAATSITWAFCANHMAGYPDGTFGPNLDITRGQLARFLYRVAGSPDVSALPPASWSDIPTWLDDAARWLDDAEIMSGYPDGTFGPNLPITRGQVARASFRMQGSPAGAPSHPFTDVPPWLDEAVDWAANDPDGAGVRLAPMAGYPDNTFRDGNDITRAQTVRLTCRANSPPGDCILT